MKLEKTKKVAQQYTDTYNDLISNYCMNNVDHFMSFEMRIKSLENDLGNAFYEDTKEINSLDTCLNLAKSFTGKQWIFKQVGIK